MRTLKGHSSGVKGISVTPDGQRAVSGSVDKTLRVWDLESGECLQVASASAAIFSVALGWRSTTICAGTESGEVLFLSVTDAQT